MKNSEEKEEIYFLFLSGFLVMKLIKWLLQAISCGKLVTLNEPGLKKIFFLQSRNPRGWYSEVKQQLGGFYRTKVLRGSVLRFWIFLFKISNINIKTCPGPTPQRVINTPENLRFVSSCYGRFKFFCSNLSFSTFLILNYFLNFFKMILNDFSIIK